ncbi:MAG: right-handed parallel beta-helix repeat-containing protein, partial [Deltaproteobacteria bacterium]|nr:right-handed parallel beta-helix repeat-containing protein [Deltaproteobacteria bacterium]
MIRIYIPAILCFLVVSSASAAPATATVSVDCHKGQKISNALNRPADELIIEISGICEEDVEISRTHVTLRGTDPLTDGIRPVPGGPERQVITLVGANFINLENLSLTGAFTGIGINYTFGVLVSNCIIKDNSFSGVLAGTASGSLNVVDTVITSSGAPANRAIWATNGSNITCTRCEIDNHRTGIMLTQGSQVNIVDSRVLATRRGVDAFGGSRFQSFGTPSTIEGGSGASHAAIHLTDNASATLFSGDCINGSIRLTGKSVATLWGTAQS